MKQPFLGIAATILVMAVSLALISFFDFPTFAGWVSYGLMCLIPMQIVVGVTWGANQPGFAAKQRQPLKGLLLLFTTLLVGVVVVPALLVIAGGNVKPPTPMLMHVTIVSVVVTFWGAIIMGGWPFKATIRNEVAAGLALVSQRAHALEQRSGATKRGASGRLTHFVSKFRNRFTSSIF